MRVIIAITNPRQSLAEMTKRRSLYRVAVFLAFAGVFFSGACFRVDGSPGGGGGVASNALIASSNEPVIGGSVVSAFFRFATVPYFGSVASGGGGFFALEREGPHPSLGEKRQFKRKSPEEPPSTREATIRRGQSDLVPEGR